MQGRPGRKPRQHLRDASLALAQEDRLRLVDALRLAKSLQGAARSYGETHLPTFRRLAIREGFGALLRPLIYPLRNLNKTQHIGFMRAVRMGEPAASIARRYGVKRQAVEQRIQRLGLWGTYRVARCRAKARNQGFWAMLTAPPYRRLLPIAAALSARGMTVGCVPVLDTACRRVVDCRLVADNAIVRVLRPGASWRGRYPVTLRDMAAHYVVATPDGDVVWYAPPHSPGKVEIPAGKGGALALYQTAHPPTGVWRAIDWPDPWAEEPTADPCTPADQDVPCAVPG